MKVGFVNNRLKFLNIVLKFNWDCFWWGLIGIFNKMFKMIIKVMIVKNIKIIF